MDRRQFPRLPFDLWVREERGDFFFLYRCTNISEGGLFLAGRKIDVQTILPKPVSKFYIPLPTLKEVLVLKGTTKWQRITHTSDNPSGSAIEFKFTPLKFLYAIRKFQKRIGTEKGLNVTNESL